MIDQEQIENAAQAMAETAGSWEERCYSIMAMLDLDFGEFSTDVPDVGSWYEVNHKRQQEIINRLEDENRELRLEVERLKQNKGDHHD